MLTKTTIGYKATCDDPECVADPECRLYLDMVSETIQDAASKLKKMGWDVRNGKTICPCCKE